MNDIPPVVCRILARHRRGRRALSSRELSIISGLDRHTIDRLSLKKNWVGVNVVTAVKFALACGINHLNARRDRELFKTGRLVHILNAPPGTQGYYRRLIRIAKTITQA